MTGQQSRPRRDRTTYHHGDLKTALIDAAIELIGERGVRGFSLAEVSRHVGVAVSAPYAHFATRDDLLAAVAVRACQVLHARMLSELDSATSPAQRLSAISRAYVRFSATHRAMFDVLTAGVDKIAHPEVASAEEPISAAFQESVRALYRSGAAGTANLATAIEATAHGHAMMLRVGDFGQEPDAVDRAADLAARATLALIGGRRMLA